MTTNLLLRCKRRRCFSRHHKLSWWKATIKGQKMIKRSLKQLRWVANTSAKFDSQTQTTESGAIKRYKKNLRKNIKKCLKFHQKANKSNKAKRRGIRRWKDLLTLSGLSPYRRLTTTGGTLQSSLTEKLSLMFWRLPNSLPGFKRSGKSVLRFAACGSKILLLSWVCQDAQSISGFGTSKAKNDCWKFKICGVICLNNIPLQNSNVLKKTHESDV